MSLMLLANTTQDTLCPHYLALSPFPGTHLGHSHLKVLLRDVHPPLPQCIHPCLCAHTLRRQERNISQCPPCQPQCPQSPQLTFTSAPEAPGISSAIFRRLMPRVRFIFREWILRMSRRAWGRGTGRVGAQQWLPGRG